MKNLQEFGKRVKQKRQELQMTQEELARAVGYTSRSSINKLELGLIDVPQSKLIALAKALGVTESWLMGYDTYTDASDAVPSPSNIRPIAKKKFPVLGSIACGAPIFAEQEYESFIEASADIKADFCLIAKGDSMIDARIHDGDVVFIRRQPIVENGEIAAVIIEDEATLKRWYYDATKKKLVLNPANPAYEPLVYVSEELDHIVCLGRAVCFMSGL